MINLMEWNLQQKVLLDLMAVLKPGGMLLAFFHTREAGPDAPCYRYHIVDNDILEMQHVEARRDLRRGPTGALHTSIEKSFRSEEEMTFMARFLLL